MSKGRGIDHHTHPTRARRRYQVVEKGVLRRVTERDQGVCLLRIRMLLALARARGRLLLRAPQNRAIVWGCRSVRREMMRMPEKVFPTPRLELFMTPGSTHASP